MFPTNFGPAGAVTSGPSLRVLRIVVVALAGGVISFALVAISQNAAKPLVLGGKLQPLNVMLLGMGLAAAPLGVFLPLIVFNASRKQTASAVLAKDALSARILAIQQRIHVATIVGCAVLEGGAFANVFGYLQTRELLHLILAGLLVLCILARFPTASGYQQQIDDELRRLQEQELLQR